MKFSVYLREPNWSTDQLCEFVGKVENLGFHGIYTNDHLTGFDKNLNGKEPYLESWTFITCVLMWSHHLHAGHQVLCQSFRNPALLAKMIATLDNLSNGRFELFLGSGWKEEEYLAYGYPFPSIKERFQQLEEQVTIIRQLLDSNIPEFDFSGQFWTLKKAINFPKPHTQPFPIVIGGTKPKIIKLAAKIGDGLNNTGSLAETAPYYHLYDSELIKLGKDPHSYQKSYFGSLKIFKNESEMLEAAKVSIESNPESLTKDPHEFINERLWGTPDMLVEKIRQFSLQTDVKHYVLAYRSTFNNPLDCFHDEILPKIC